MKTLRTPAIQLKLSEANGSVPAKVEVIRLGHYFHDEYGEFEVTLDVLQSFVDNFEKGVRGIDLAMDYSHDAGGPAAGWFRSLEINNESLWAEIDWTPQAQKMIQDKEFRYISADFATDYQDTEGDSEEDLPSYGPTLFGAALTNRPFVKKMAPVVQLTEGKESPMDPKDKEIAELKKQIAALQAELQKGGKKAGEPVNPPESPEQESAPADKPVNDDDADDRMDESYDDLKKKYEEMAAEMDKMKCAMKADADKAELAEKESAFNKMLAEGKVVAAQKEAWIKGDLKKFAELSKTVKLAAVGSGESPAEGVDADPQAEAIKRAKKLMEGDKKLSVGEAIRKVLSEDEALNERYKKAVEL